MQRLWHRRQEPKGDSKGMGKAPSLTIERSRNQIMCRTGLGGPGSTEKFAYGKNCKFASEGHAKAAAIKWVQAAKKKRGLE
jgi:predicted lysophospholipase L1 biosynthesis ABC-type transport system permease subunit